MSQIIVLGLLLCTVTLAVDQKSFALIPGKQVATVAIGMDRPKVHAEWGSPMSSRTAERGRGVPRDSWAEAGGYKFVYYGKKNEVIQVYLMSSKYRTSDGLSTESKLKAAKDRYKKLKRVKAILDEGSANIYDAVDEGIAFYSEDETAIQAIYIHLPGKSVITF